MKLLYFICLFSFSNLSFSQDDEELFLFKDFSQENSKVDISHFVFNLDTTMMIYRSNSNYIGNKASVSSSDNVAYIGPKISLGYRFNLFSGISTTSRVSAFYLQQRQRDVEFAREDIELIINQTEEDNKMLGAEISQDLLYRFEISENYYFEPFIQTAIGYAVSRNEFKHTFNDFINTEYYDSKIKENILFQNLSLGFNIFSRNGLLFYFKASKNVFTIGEVSEEGKRKEISSTVETNFEEKKDVKETRDEYSLSVGFGYIF